MKIQKIIIKNLASIPWAEIDFTTGSLKDSPLFIISGETGAGKTTITDAVCLSFYGQSPRFADVSGDKLEILGLTGKNSGMAISDRRNFMRKGTGEAYAETVFEGDDGKVYKAQWLARRANKKPDGTFQPAVNTLFRFENDVFVPLNEKQKEFEEKIIALTGYDYQRFVRCVLLAQNQFSKFLNAKSDEKADILQMLTDTSVYEKVSMKIFERRKIEFEKLDRLKERVGEMVFLSDEEIAEKKIQIENCAKKEKELHAELIDIQQKISWFKQLAALQADVETRQKEYNVALENYNQAAGLRTKAAGIKLALEKFKTPFEHLEKLRNQRDRIESEYLSIGRDAGLIFCGVKKLKSTLIDVRAGLAKAKQEFDDMQGLSGIYENIQAISAALDNLEALEKNIDQTNLSIEKLSQSKKDSLLDLETQKKHGQIASDNYNKAVEELTVESSKLEGWDISKLQEQNNALSTRLNALKGAGEIFSLIDKYNVDLLALNKRCDEKEKKLGELKSSIAENSKKLELAMAEYNMAKLSLNNMLKISSDDLKKERQKLREGDECPLCGSKNHPFCSEGEQVIDRMLESAQQLAVEKENAKSLLDKSLAADKKLLNEITLELEKLQNEEKNKVVAELEKQTLRREKMRVYFGFPENCDLQVAVANETKVCTEKKQELEKNISFFNSQNTIIENKKRDCDTKKDVLQKIVAKISDIENNVKTLSAIITEKDGALQKDLLDKKSVVSVLGGYYGDSEFWLEKSQRKKEKFCDGAKRFSMLKEKIVELNLELKKLEDIDAQCSNVGDLEKHYPQVSGEMLSILPKDIEMLPIKIASTLQNAENKNAERNKNNAEILVITEQINNLILQENQKQIEEQLTLEKIESYLAVGELQREDILKKIRNIDNCLLESQTVLKSSQENFENHKQQNLVLLETKSPSVLENDCSIVQSQTSDNAAIKAKLATQLEEDASKKVDFEKLKNQMSEQQSIFDDWNFLNENFGSSDGKKLKRAAQTFTLKILLENANIRLKKIMPRYSLFSPPGTLDILITDREENAPRPVSTVSGGESFMLSLALALGLSDMMQAGKGSETLFVDEGFGTLDSANLAKVISMLEKLHLQGRKVGIISHVRELQERIPAKIMVEKCQGDNTKSVVRVV